MQAGNCLRVRTLSTSQFTGGLAQGVAAIVDLDIVAAALAAGGDGAGVAGAKHVRTRLHELRILSKENLAWAVELWGSATGIAGTDIDACKFLGRWEFTAGMGKKDNADTFYKYWVPGLDLSYQDLDQTGKLHIRLINLSAAAKSAGTAGAIVVEFALEPTIAI